MKQFTSAYTDSIDQTVTTLCTCIRILTKIQNKEFTYTTLDKEIEVDGKIYKPTNSFVPTAIQTSSDLKVNNLDITGIVTGEDVTELQIFYNLFLDAEVWIFDVDYTNPTGGIDRKLYGNIGNVTLRDGSYTAEFRSITQRLSQNIIELYSRTCRVKFGSQECGITTYKKETGTVTGVVVGNYNFYTNLSLDGNFTHGLVNWLSGGNAGSKYDVKGHSTGAIILYLPTFFDIKVNDTFEITEGCNHLYTGDCQYTWENTVNFRGEPHMPSSDRITGNYGTIRT